MRHDEVARGVRVKHADTFKPRSIADEYLILEDVIFISETHIYNDRHGDYVFLRGGSLTTSSYAYLDELNLEYPVPNKPLY